MSVPGGILRIQIPPGKRILGDQFRYTGREWDSEIGLYYYRARYYDPFSGRFITRDPLGLAAGDINFYRYVGNNPINYVDPLGLQMCGKSYWDKVWNNYVNTHKAPYGFVARRLGMLVTGWKIQQLTQSISGLQWVRHQSRNLYNWLIYGRAWQPIVAGGVSWTTMESFVIASGFSVTNLAYGGGAFEVGVGIGSLLAPLAPSVGTLEQEAKFYWLNYDRDFTVKPPSIENQL